MDIIGDLDSVGLVALLTKAIGAIIVLIATLVVAGWAQRVVRGSLERSRLDATLAIFGSKFARYGVLILGGLAVLGLFGIPIASFAAILAASAFAVGLALQGTLSHFASGVMLLIFRPFKVGDSVSVAGVAGIVAEIDLFSTFIDTPDNRRIIVPNGAIFGSTIENVSHHRTRRVEVTVGTDYAADLGRTRAVLEKVATSIEGGLKDPAPAVSLVALGPSSVDWVVRIWAQSADFGSVRERLTVGIKEALDERGIGIPFPQLDVHLNGLGPIPREAPAIAIDAGPVA